MMYLKEYKDNNILEMLVKKYGPNKILSILNESNNNYNFSLERIGYNIGIYWIKNNNKKIGILTFAENSDNICYLSKMIYDKLFKDFEYFFYNDEDFIYDLSELRYRRNYYIESFNNVEYFADYMRGAYNEDDSKIFAKAIKFLSKNNPIKEEYYNWKTYYYKSYM